MRELERDALRPSRRSVGEIDDAKTTGADAPHDLQLADSRWHLAGHTFLHDSRAARWTGPPFGSLGRAN